MIDRKYVGKAFPTQKVEVEKGQLLFFAKATGETNPVFYDEAAAAAAGHRALPAPPTFAFSLGLLAPPSDEASVYAELDLPLAHILHGEQGFDYHAPIYAGDAITLTSRIADIYEKRGGALEFLVVEGEATNQDGQLCVRQRSVMVIQRPGAPA